MVKKFLSIFVVLGLFIVGVQYAGAAAAIPTLEGDYAMFGGKMKVDMKSGLGIDIKGGMVPKYMPLLDVSATIYDTALLLTALVKGGFQFGAGEANMSGKPPFYMTGPVNMMLGDTSLIAGTYKLEVDAKTKLPKSNKFVVDISMDPIIDPLIAQLQPTLDQYGFAIEIKRTKGLMTGTVAIKNMYGDNVKLVTCVFSGAFSIYVGPKPDEGKPLQPLLTVSLAMSSQPNVIAAMELPSTAGVMVADEQPPKGPDAVAQLTEMIARHIESAIQALEK